MQKISFKPLSEGLGFNEELTLDNASDKEILFDNLITQELLTHQNLPTHQSSLIHQNSLTHQDSSHLDSLTYSDSLSENLNWTDIKHYNNLISLKDIPWLVETKNNSKNIYPKKSLHKDITLKESLHKETNLKASKSKNIFCFSLKSYIIDIGIVSVFFFIPLIVFIVSTTINPSYIFLVTWPFILLSFLVFSQIYCIICRLFCFKTYGESITNIKLYTHSNNISYPLILLWRFVLLCTTGVIVIPLLSFIFQKDFTSNLTGLYFKKI